MEVCVYVYVCVTEGDRGPERESGTGREGGRMGNWLIDVFCGLRSHPVFSSLALFALSLSLSLLVSCHMRMYWSHIAWLFDLRDTRGP